MEELINVISQFISNVGFPIVAYLLMTNNQKETTKALTDVSATLKTIDLRLDMLENKEVSHANK